MRILNGKKISQDILLNLKKKIAKEKVKPGLGVVLVGNNKASQIYVGLKGKACQEVGINFNLVKLSGKCSDEKVLEKIEKLNKDKSIHGIIVQLPLPKPLNKSKIIGAIDPRKDVDGFHKNNVKLFLQNKNRFVPVFPGAILKLIEASRRKIAKSKAIIIANSKEFGEIMKILLNRKGAQTDYTLRKDIGKNLEKIKKADIIVSACGIPNLVNGEMMKNGAVVIDGGIVKKGKKTLGDVDLESTKKMSGFISPVPGGVGPVTVAMLLQNTFEAMKKSC